MKSKMRKIENSIRDLYGKSQYAVEMHNITKTFGNGSIIANEDISLLVKTNTIHAIIGENGAGKSTLMSILFGIYQPNAGTIKINGEAIHFHSAQDATKVGLGMVHQHFKLVQVFSLLENIILGSEVTKRFGFLDLDKAKQKIQSLSKKYKLNVDLNKKVEDASVGEQQRVEILKLLYRDSNILIFDEPTAVLSDSEIKNFLKMVLDFKKQGKTIIIITHKLNEVKEIADEATIIRLGKKINHCNVSATPIHELSSMMVGRQLHIQKNHMLSYKKDEQMPILKIDNLHVKNISGHKIDALKGISFNVHKGEILGIAGIEGNGQTELALTIGGLVKPTHGSIKLVKTSTNKLDLYETIDLTNLSVKEIYQHGISHVPEDRHKYGLLLDETVSYNCVAPIIDQKPFSH
jgi:simple sugar transport system ATP-binding protein